MGRWIMYEIEQKIGVKCLSKVFVRYARSLIFYGNLEIFTILQCQNVFLPYACERNYTHNITGNI